MPITLTQQTALITGASRGVGRGIALKLAEQGVKKIAINYNENDAAAEDTVRLLRERGVMPLAIKADIGKVADIHLRGTLRFGVNRLHGIGNPGTRA